MGRTPISHVVYGAQDVEVTAARLRRGLGLQAIPGSRFDDLGLVDWFVPFEGQYIELLSVADEEVAVRTPFGRWVAERTATGDRLLAWGLEAEDDIDAVGRRLGAEPDALTFVDRTGVIRASRLAARRRPLTPPDRGRGSREAAYASSRGPDLDRAELGAQREAEDDERGERHDPQLATHDREDDRALLRVGERAHVLRRLEPAGGEHRFRGDD